MNTLKWLLKWVVWWFIAAPDLFDEKAGGDVYSKRLLPVMSGLIALVGMLTFLAASWASTEWTEVNLFCSLLFFAAYLFVGLRLFFADRARNAVIPWYLNGAW